jgi:hypothetical protein
MSRRREGITAWHPRPSLVPHFASSTTIGGRLPRSARNDIQRLVMSLRAAQRRSNLNRGGALTSEVQQAGSGGFRAVGLHNPVVTTRGRCPQTPGIYRFVPGAGFKRGVTAVFRVLGCCTYHVNSPGLKTCEMRYLQEARQVRKPRLGAHCLWQKGGTRAWHDSLHRMGLEVSSSILPQYHPTVTTVRRIRHNRKPQVR